MQRIGTALGDKAPIIPGSRLDEYGRHLHLADAPRVEASLSTGPFAPSEYCFANLWLFRDRHAYRLVDDPLPHLRGVTYDGAVHALLLADPSLQRLRQLAVQGVSCLYPVDERVADEFTRRFGLTCHYDAADSDYWYDGADIAALARTKDRRAQARRFAEQQTPVWQEWTPDLADDARAILAGWSADVARPADATDVVEAAEAITLSVELGLQGGLVRTGSGVPVAFLLASRADDRRIIHFAKGRRAYSHAYPWMFSAFAAHSGARWLNFEQDLGNPGLARSKRAYAPNRLQPKYRVGLAQLR